MANKYSKANKQADKKEQSVERRGGFSKGARIMAILMIVIMVGFAVVSSVFFLLD